MRGVGIKVPALFNLAVDIGEQNDLIAAESAKAAELQTLWNAWNAEQMEPLWLPNGGNKQAGL